MQWVPPAKPAGGQAYSHTAGTAVISSRPWPRRDFALASSKRCTARPSTPRTRRRPWSVRSAAPAVRAALSRGAAGSASSRSERRRREWRARPCAARIPLESLVVLPAGHPARAAFAPRRRLRRAPRAGRCRASRAARRALRFFRRFGDGDVDPLPRLRRRLVASGAAAPGRDACRESAAPLATLARSGAPIAALNRLRTALSAVKGGRLGRATRARLVTLVLSDVPGRPRGPRRIGTDGARAARRPRARRRVEPAWPRCGRFRRAPTRLRRRARCRRPVAGEARTAGARLAGLARRAVPGDSSRRGRRDDGRPLGRALRGPRRPLPRARALRAPGSSRGTGRCICSRRAPTGATAAPAPQEPSPTDRRSPGLSAAARSGAARSSRHDTRAVFASLGDLFETGPTGTNVGDWVFLIRLLKSPGRAASARPGARKPL